MKITISGHGLVNKEDILAVFVQRLIEQNIHQLKDQPSNDKPNYKTMLSSIINCR